MERDELESQVVSIGAVARETGISIEALRMWERRYGFPRSIRLPSGHRRYPLNEIERLRLASRALEAGFRARDVAGASIDDLTRMLQSARQAEDRAARHRGENPVIARWKKLMTGFDETQLTAEFHREWSELGPLNFVVERAVPLMQAIGHGWEAGELAVGHEHFVSEKMGDFLATMWRRMNERAEGPPVILSTLPGDLYRLGLQLCAVVAASAETRVLFLGAHTPPEEKVKVAREHRALAVAISISHAMDPRHVIPTLQQLRLDLPPSIPIVIGGAGAPREVEGVLKLADMRAFHDWLRARRLGV